jgi:hypothetical protein
MLQDLIPYGRFNSDDMLIDFWPARHVESNHTFGQLKLERPTAPDIFTPSTMRATSFFLNVVMPLPMELDPYFTLNLNDLFQPELLYLRPSETLRGPWWRGVPC